MPGFSKETAPNVGEFGPVTDRHDEIDGYTISIASFAAEIDGAPLLRGLKDDLCQCPHWGYVVKGTASTRSRGGSASSRETIKTGRTLPARPMSAR